MIRNKVVWDKHYNSNRLTERNIFLFCYSRFRLMCTFKLICDTWLQVMILHVLHFCIFFKNCFITVRVVFVFTLMVVNNYNDCKVALATDGNFHFGYCCFYKDSDNGAYKLIVFFSTEDIHVFLYWL